MQRSTHTRVLPASVTESGRFEAPAIHTASPEQRHPASMRTPPGRHVAQGAQGRQRLPGSAHLPKLLAFALVVSLSATVGAAEGPRKVIVDDDGFGLMHMLLLNAAGVEVLGITEVSGNTWVNRGTASALKGVEAAARTDVPVVPGATYPLVNSERLTAQWESMYGRLVWKGAWMKAWAEPTQQPPPPYFGPNDPVMLPGGNPRTAPADEIAANFLIRMVRAYPGEVTILATGPMTNLALAQRLDPEFAKLAKELVYMGGSLRPRRVLDNRSAREFAREFENTPRREFNIFWDPEAASIVARSPWRKITMVPVDPSTATQLTAALKKNLAAAAEPAEAEWVIAREEGFPLWDEIAAAVWLDPALVTRSETLYVDFDTTFGAGYGNTLSWREHYQPGLGERLQQVVISVDTQRLYARMAHWMAGGP